MTRGPTWSGGISGSVPASTTSVTPPSWSRAGPYPVSWSQLLMAAPVPRSPAPGSPPRWIRRGWTIQGRFSSSFRPPQRRLHNTARRHHPWRWRGPVTALVADPVDGSVQVPGCVDMDDDNLTRVDPDAEDRVRLVAQRPAQAVEDIGFHRFTLPFRSRPGHAGRPGIEIAGRLGMNRVVGRLGPSGRGKTCRRSARRGRSGVGPPAGRGDHPPGGRAFSTLEDRRQRPRGRGGRCRTWCCGPIAGSTSPRGLLAVVGGVVLHEALDELVDGAGRGPVALAGLVGQLVLGQARVALTGLVVGLRALLPLDPRGLPGLLPLGLLGRLTGLGLDPLHLRSLVAGGPLEGVDAAAGGVGDALHLLAHGAADRIDLLAGDAGQRVGSLGEGAGVRVVEVHDPVEDGELPFDAVGGVELRKDGEGREGLELVGDGAHAAL